MPRHIIATLIKDPKAVAYHQELVTDVAQKFQLPQSLVPSHITLKDSFYTEDIAEVITAIKQTLASHLGINATIELEGIGTFGDRVFFIDCSVSEELQKLHQTLRLTLKGIDWMQWEPHETVEPHNPHFHLTVTRYSNAEVAPAIAEHLADENQKFTVTFDNIAILRQDPDTKVWEVIWEQEV